MRKIVLIAAVLATAITVAGYVYFGGERKVPIRYKSAPVERGTIVAGVAATGT